MTWPIIKRPFDLMSPLIKCIKQKRMGVGRAGAAAVALPDRTACRGGALSLRLGSARHVLLCPSMQTTSSRRCVRGNLGRPAASGTDGAGDPELAR
jgi:hypothetical protein